MSPALCKTAVLLVMVMALCLSGHADVATVRPQTQDQAEKIGPSPNLEEEIHAGPKDIKEEIGTYVFLGWLWLSIFVMIYLLRQKIREIDRLHSYKYFEASEKKPSVQDLG